MLGLSKQLQQQHHQDKCDTQNNNINNNNNNIKRQTFWDSMKLNEWLYLATSLTIDWSKTTTTTKGRRKTAHDQIPGHSKSGFISLFARNDHVFAQQHSTLSNKFNQSINCSENKNNEAKKTRLQNINNNINFQTTTTTANVKMNVRRVEEINNNNNRKTKWQMTAKWENKSGSSSPKKETTQHHMIMATTTKQQQHLMNSTYRRQNI